MRVGVRVKLVTARPGHPPVSLDPTTGASRFVLAHASPIEQGEMACTRHIIQTVNSVCNVRQINQAGFSVVHLDENGGVASVDVESPQAGSGPA